MPFWRRSWRNSLWANVAVKVFPALPATANRTRAVPTPRRRWWRATVEGAAHSWARSEEAAEKRAWGDLAGHVAGRHHGDDGPRTAAPADRGAHPQPT